MRRGSLRLYVIRLSRLRQEFDARFPGLIASPSGPRSPSDVGPVWRHPDTAEEDRHSHVLHACLHATRAVDPVALERQRMRAVSSGYRRENQPTVLHDLAYVTVQELAPREAHRDTGTACGDRLGHHLMSHIAADENLHMLFYRDFYADAPNLFHPVLAGEMGWSAGVVTRQGPSSSAW
ncbi:acyl-ACP desaturase [Streptomyces sp. NPDC005009]